MPNCTCYAWGRFWEESNQDINDMSNKPTQLPLSDGGQWWQDAVSSGYYQTGQTPELGAVICFSDNYGGAGHVAIVEEINSQTQEITCSNSAWQSTFFWLSYITPVQGQYDWSHYTFQGFIYNPFVSPTPPVPPSQRIIRKFPWAIYSRKLREKRRGQ